MSHDHIDDFEKGRSSMIKSMRTSATPLTRKEKKGIEKTCAIASPISDADKKKKARVPTGLPPSVSVGLQPEEIKVLMDLKAKHGENLNLDLKDALPPHQTGAKSSDASDSELDQIFI